MQNISANGYVLHVSYLSYISFVSTNINEKKWIFLYFYRDKFDKNSFRADDKGTSNTKNPNMKTDLNAVSLSLNFILLQRPKWVKTVE